MAHPDRGGLPGGACRNVAMQSILRIDAGQSLQVGIVSPAVCGVWTHYIDGHRTYPCLGPATVCYFDHLTTSCRWQGWLQVTLGPGKASRFLCLTEAAARDCPSLFAKAGRLSGRKLLIYRMRHSARGRMCCVPSSESADWPLPPAASLRHWLLSMWEQPSMWPVGANGSCRQSPLTVAEVAWDDSPFSPVEAKEMTT